MELMYSSSFISPFELPFSPIAVLLVVVVARVVSPVVVILFSAVAVDVARVVSSVVVMLFSAVIVARVGSLVVVKLFSSAVVVVLIVTVGWLLLSILERWQRGWSRWRPLSAMSSP